MRTIKIAALAAFFSSLLLLTGCASTQGADQAAQSFSATAARICAVVQPTLASVTAEAGLLNPPLAQADQDKLSQASNAATTFCNATATASSATAQGMLNSTIPAVMQVVANSSQNASSRNALLLSLVGVQTAANVLLSQAQAATPVQAQ
jgi:hypothetical protein